MCESTTIEWEIFLIPRFSLKTMLIVVLAIALVIAIPLQILRHLEARARDGYSQRIVVVLLIKFMEENQGKWPRSWNSLKPLFEREYPSFKSGTFEELKQRIFVDFSADVQRMRADSLTFDKPTFRVVFAKFSSGFHPMGEPNSTIHNYLRESVNKGSKNVATETDSVETEK